MRHNAPQYTITTQSH